MAKKDQANNTTTTVRPPIVTVMGHVDHGKTSLLDYIRKTRVAAKEHGGITQHIGAYQVEVAGEKGSKKLITFIDTPGHAAFEKMRSRGGQVADIVVLVIAANEGIKPQTKESLQHIDAAKVPFIVALTKGDLPDANPDMVKNQLTELGYLTEDRGGQIASVLVSAFSGKGIDELLEMILLVAELEELQANSSVPAIAMVIESVLDARKGPVATVIVKEGTLRLKDEIFTEKVTGKVKAMFNEFGKGVQQATPSTPVQVLGFNDVPAVGSIVQVGNAEAAHQESVNKSVAKAPADAYVKAILKADTSGTLEALHTILPEGVHILQSSVGDINETDVALAKTTGAEIVGFNIGISNVVRSLADTEGVNAKTFRIIYELQTYLEDEKQRAIDPYYGKEIVGEAKILAQFTINRQRIAGCKLLSGEIAVRDTVDIKREENSLGRTRVSNLQQGQTKVEKVSKGIEFGAQFSPYLDFKMGDTIIAYRDKK